MKRISLAWLTLVATLSACAGGGGGAPPARTVAPSGNGKTTATFVIRIGKRAGAGTTSARKKYPQFVSPSSIGAYVQIYADANKTTLDSSYMNDVSPSSQACTANSDGSRTCTIVLNAPPGTSYGVVSLYDSTALASGAPSGHLLGISPVTQLTVVADQNNGPFAFFVGGVITSINDVPSFASLPADGSTHDLGLVFEPTDFGNNPITAGSNDPYANPITVSVAETGGSGHTLLSLNGGTGAASVTITHSTDTVAIVYDGGGASGYSATVSVSAQSVDGSTAPATQMLVVSPMYLAVSGNGSGHGASFTASGDATVTITEAGAPANGGETSSAGTYYAATESGCKGVATETQPSGTGLNSTSTISETGAGQCSIVYTDGTSSITVTVDSTASSGTVTVPGGSFATTNFDDGNYSAGPMIADYSQTYGSGPLQGASVGQGGWSGNSCGNAPYDANIVSGNANTPAGHTLALQFSNAVFQGCFSGLASKITAAPAGVPSSLLDTLSGGSTTCGPTCNPYYAVQFTVASATGAWQQGLVTSLSPDYANDGARMSYLALWHTKNPADNSNALLVFFVDVEGATGVTPCFECANFIAYPVAFVDPTTAHQIGLTMQFGTPDAVSVYIDGTQYATGPDVGAGAETIGTKSWADYYVLDTESDPNGANPYSRGVDDLYFRAGNLDGCTADTNSSTGYFSGTGCGNSGNPSEASTLTGNGYLFTDVDVCTGTSATCAGTVTGAARARRNGAAIAPAKRVKGYVLGRRAVRSL